MITGILWILAIIACLGLVPYLILLLLSAKISNLNTGLTMFVGGFHFIITAILLALSWTLTENIYLIALILIMSNIFFGFISTKYKFLYRIRDSLGWLGVPSGWFWFHKWETVDTPMESQNPILHAFLSCFLGNLWLMLSWFGICISKDKTIAFPLLIVSLSLLLILSFIGSIGGYIGKIKKQIQ